MYIEEFKNPIRSISNFRTTVKLCELCYYDALSVNCYLDDKFKFYRYLKVDNIFIYFFLAENYPHLYIVISTLGGFKVLEDYIRGVHFFDNILYNIKEVVKTINPLIDIYCVGHSVGGSYAKNISAKLNYKCLTVGELPIPKNLIVDFDQELTGDNYANFVSSKDILAKKDNAMYVDKKTTPPESILEGVVYNSINSYVQLANDLEGLTVEPVLTH